MQPPKKVDLYRKRGISGIVSFNRDGGDRRVEATGVRNSAGLAFNPKDKSLWFTDNQVDGMGDETPPGELNRMPKPGMWFGAPYYGGGQVRTDEYKDKPIPKELADKYVKPQVEMVAHAADLGMMFPAKYQNAIFSAQHGSWVDSTTKCNFEQLGKETKDVLVSKASGPASQSSHDLSTPEHKLNDIRFTSS